jgi:hypothetical protein
MLHTGATPLNVETTTLASWFRQNNGQAGDWVLVVEAINAQFINALKEKLGRTLLALWIVWRLMEIEHQESGSQIISRG